jgi:hypothetical protein
LLAPTITEWIIIYLMSCAAALMASRYLMKVDEDEDVFFFLVITLIPIINLALTITAIFHKIYRVCNTGRAHLFLRKLFGLK